MKSIIRENGNAVIPKAPQQANIGYPIKQSNPIRKQGIVVVIYIVVVVTIGSIGSRIANGGE